MEQVKPLIRFAKTEYNFVIFVHKCNLLERMFATAARNEKETRKRLLKSLKKISTVQDVKSN